MPLAAQTIRFGEFELDAVRLVLRRSGRLVRLQRLPCELLLLLIEEQESVVTRETIAQRLWTDGVHVDIEHNINTAIRKIRFALKDDAERQRYVQTVVGRGYRFVGQVVYDSDSPAPPEPAIAEPEPEEPSASLEVAAPRQVPLQQVQEVQRAQSEEPAAASLASRQLPPKRTIIAALAMTVVLTAGAALFFYSRKLSPSATSDSILLADFVNQTGDPLFDLTLRQGLAVQLEQSPMLDIFPDERIRETLRSMRLRPDARITETVAADICRREGVKAFVTGLIAPLGTHYAITLQAVDSRSAYPLARVQQEAGDKEHVLQALSQAASTLRGKLGESIRSIHKFDALLEHTTSSIDALRAYSLGHQEHLKGHFRQAILFYRDAINRDPAFAYAYAGLAALYSNTQQPQLAAEYATKAYLLRDRASELEKFAITSFYYGLATGEVSKRIEVLKLAQQSYPRDPASHTNLATTDASIGDYEESVAEARLAMRLRPDSAVANGVLGNGLVHLGRYAEAESVYGGAIARGLDSGRIRQGLFEIAFVHGDQAAMARQVQWAADNSSAYRAFEWQSRAAAFEGRADIAAEYARRGIQLLQHEQSTEIASEYEAAAALREAALGQCDEAQKTASQAVSSGSNRLSLSRAALALAWCGQAARVNPIVDELRRLYPKYTVVNSIVLPEIKAATELRQGQAENALDALLAASPYEAAGEFWPQYLRGEAYLKLKYGKKAEAEFRKIVERRGQDPISPLSPLAYLELAKAAALQNDTAQARKWNQQFLSLWKPADPDLPILRQAKIDALKWQ